MKKLFILLLATMVFVACNDEADYSIDRDVNSYTIEELQNLSEDFDITKIDQDQLLADLTEGAIWVPCYIGTWAAETGEFKYNPVFGGSYNNVQWIFGADGKAVNVSTLYEDHIPRTTYKSYDATWQYDSKTGEIEAVWNENSKEYRLKVLYYESPVLYFSQDNPWDGRTNSYIVNLRAYTKAQAETELNKLISK